MSTLTQQHLNRTPFLNVAFESVVLFSALLALSAVLTGARWPVLSPLVLLFVGLALVRELYRHGSGYFFFLRLLLIFVPLVQLTLLGPSDGFDVLGHTQRLFEGYGRQAVIVLITFFLLLEIGRVVLGVERRFARVEQDLLRTMGVSVTTWGQVILALMCLVALFIYQPSIPGTAYTDMSHNLLPGSGWNYICFLSYGVLLLERDKSLLTKLTIGFVPVWLLLHFARVDLLGLMILYFVTKRARRQKFGTIEIGTAAILLFLFVAIGVVRNEPSMSALGEVGMHELVGNRTIQDATHNLLAALAYFETKGVLNTVATTAQYIPPSFFVGDRSMNAEMLLHKTIGTHFGAHWIGEVYLNGGYIALVVGALVTSLLVPFLLFLALLPRDRTLSSLLVYHVFLALPRFCWYGIIYLVKPIIFIMPVVWLVAWIASRRDAVAGG